MVNPEICKSCPYKKSQPVLPYTKKSDILLILEDPSLLSYTVLFDETKKLIGNFSVAYSMLCPMDIKDKPKSKIREELKICRPHFETAIKQIKPKYIILSGEIPLMQFMNKAVKFTKVRGRILYNEEFNAYFITTYSWRTIIRNGLKVSPHFKFYIQDLTFFKDYITNNYKENQTPYLSIAKHIDNIKLGDILAIDCEWNPDTYELLLFSISDGINNYYAKKSDLVPTIQKKLKEILSTKKAIIFANRPVDERVLKLNSIDIIPDKILKLDIFNMARLVDDNINISLQNLADFFLNKKHIKDIVADKKITELSDEELIKYNVQDTQITLELCRIIYPKLKDENLQHYYKYFVIPVENVLAELGTQPFYIDSEQLRKNKEEVEKALHDLEIELKIAIPSSIRKKYADNLSISRSSLLIDLLYEHRSGFKLEPLEYTATGKPSLSEDVLKKYDHEWVQKYLRWKSLYKLLNTFFANIEKNLYPDGALYINQVLWRTATGRTASFNPNVQQIPRSGEMVDKLKELFKAPDGWLMCSMDLSQSEFRIMGWLANDKTILNALHNNIDVHKLTASFILNKPQEEITKEERQLAKAINFGLIYGASAKMLQIYAETNYNVKMTLEEAEEFRKKFFELYSAIPIFHEKIKRYVYRNGYVVGVLGRKRRLPHIFSTNKEDKVRAERQAINFPIQNFSAELTLLGMYLFYQEIKNRNDIRLLFQIHDSIFFISMEDSMPYYIELLNECLTQRTKEYIKKYFNVDVGYPIETEAKVGKSWAEL